MRPSVFCRAKQDRASARRSNARITAALLRGDFTAACPQRAMALRCRDSDGECRGLPQTLQRLLSLYEPKDCKEREEENEKEKFGDFDGITGGCGDGFSGLRRQ